ncbi:hypothetical protein [Plesiomonas shigelloides]|uniref:hypothetical protein n=1 Tax=Plesiomonas shigelloides TaxID=703 RepID=UPI0022460B81|nr:hypothetical protein [Plesiomonas shigelloides]MCX2499466.1 hypothetical protein [Plesiomonas shigelloides]
MTIEDLSKLAQIIFYITMGTVAILTYKKAKSTLMNTVNTEYQKHVITTLINISNEVYSEFDITHDNHWSKANNIKTIVEEINNEFTTHKDQIIKEGEFNPGIRSSNVELRLNHSLQKYKSDPLLPDEIRDSLTNLLKKRLKAEGDIRAQILNEYRHDLANGKYNSDLDRNYLWLSNEINHALYDRGCGISQIEDEIHSIRIKIKDYLNSYNPLKNP